MTVSMEQRGLKDSVTAGQYDVVVVGAGPYGLAATAHLRANGLKVAIFGKPLELWRDHMPKGMLLRSYWWAVDLSDPERKYTLKNFLQLKNDLDGPDPLPIETFLDYTVWYQTHVVPDVDETYVACVERRGGYFEVTLVDGRVIHSPVVVMASGLAYYTNRPAEYSHISAELLTHTSDHYTFDGFEGRRVVVIGGGQSALEISALLHEHGAHVEMVSRRGIRWLGGNSLADRPLIKRIRHPKAGIAPGWFNWGLENLPYAFHALPRETRDRLLRGRGQYGPAGAAWLKPRILGNVTVHEGQKVLSLKETDNGVAVALSNNKTLLADHVITGTGYQVDISKLPMLPPQLVLGIRTYNKAPVLNNCFESNIPGLYFVGISSVASFGPFYRFVVGNGAAARRVAKAATRQVAHLK